MSFNTYPQNPFPSNSGLFEKLDEVAKAIDNMPTFTSDDRAFLEELPPFPNDDGTKVLTAITESGETSLSYEEVESGIVNYSTTEQKTGQKWIDGKDIFVKVLSNVADLSIIASNVDTIVNATIARHGTSTDSNRHVFGDGFTVNDGASILLDTTTHNATYAVWASTGGSLEKTADHIIIEYTKTESEV